MWIIITKKGRILVRTSGSLPLPPFFGPTAIRGEPQTKKQ